MKDRENARLNEANRLFKEKDDIFNSVAVKAGMTDTAFWVLYAICNNDRKMSQADITELWYFPRQTINSVVRKLQMDGYVVLEHIEGKRASKAVVLTNKGHELCNKYVLPLMQAEEKAFGSLSPEEQERLVGLLRKHNKLFREYVEGI